MRLIDMGFAIIGLLARHCRPPIRFLFIGSRFCSTLLSGPRLAASVISPLRFAIFSRPSRCEEDFHLQTVEHAWHTKKGHAFARPRHHLTVSTRLELVPQELVVNLVVELDLWRLNDGPEQAGAAVG